MSCGVLQPVHRYKYTLHLYDMTQCVSLTSLQLWDALTYSFLGGTDQLQLASIHSAHQARLLQQTRGFGRKGSSTRRRNLSVAFVSVHLSTCFGRAVTITSLQSDYGAHAVGAVVWSLFRLLNFRTVCIATKEDDGSQW